MKASGVVLDFSGAGKPIDDAFIEAFDGEFRQECVNDVPNVMRTA